MFIGSSNVGDADVSPTSEGSSLREGEEKCLNKLTVYK